jgi:hypothetical protein
MATLARLAAELPALARTVSGGTTPPSPSYLSFRFRPALDAVAGYLTRQYAVDGMVQPPRTYPAGWQTAIMLMAEAVRAAQEWELRQEWGSEPLPPAVLATLEDVVWYVQREVRGFEAAPLPETADELLTGEAAARGGTETVLSEGKRQRMSVGEAAERLNRLRLQGEPYTGQRQLAQQLGCSPSTIGEAMHSDPKLEQWAKPPEAAPRAVGQPRGAEPGGKEPDPAGHEADPAEAAAEAELRELMERDPEERAFINEIRPAHNGLVSWYVQQTPAVRRACRTRWGEHIASDRVAKAWFFSLTARDQIGYFDDPDRGPKIPPRV